MYQSVQPTQTFQIPYLLEDMTSILCECAFEPFRLKKTDGNIFTKTAKALAERLISIDLFYEQTMKVTPDYRVHSAIPYLHHLELIQVKGKQWGDRHFAITKEGEQWLTFSPKERLKAILDHIKNPNKKKDSYGYTKGIPLIPKDYTGYYYGLPDVSKSVLNVFSSMKQDGFISMAEFIEVQRQTSNPLLSFYKLKKRNWFGITEDTITGIWIESLDLFLNNRLLPLGGVCVGPMMNGGIAFCLSDIGAYLLSKTDEFQYEHTESDKIIVQPNFEVFFPEPSPKAEVALSKYAQRTGKRIGNVFQITAASIKQAAYTGITMESILDSLSTLSKKQLPDNVRHEIVEWYGQVRHIDIKNALVIQCPDLETAAKVYRAGGKKIEAVTDTVLICTDLKQRQVLIKKLRDKGVFVKKNQ